jgi:hypothetical protein
VGASSCVGTLAVGPHGEIAFPIGGGEQTSLALLDGDAPLRVLTSGDRLVTEAAFGPDGTRLVFHDARAEGGGLFVVEASGKRAPLRLTSDSADSAPAWLDADHVVFLRPEQGLPMGRTYVVAAAGDEPAPLPPIPGNPMGSVPSRGSLLLFEPRDGGDRFVEWTRDGRARELRLEGIPKGMSVERYIASSPSGRYVAWYSGGAAWRADLESARATRIDCGSVHGSAQTIQPDDDGRIIVSARRYEGQLYEASGVFP